MAFPTTSVLDDFNSGASQALSARGGWSSGHFQFGDFTTDSTPTKAVGGGSNADNIWNTNFTDPEVWVTITDWPGTTGSWRVVGRWSGSGTKNFYAMFIYSTGWNLQRFDNNTATVNIASGGLSPAAGDSVGLSCIGSTISGYHKPSAGSWGLLGSGTDAVWSAAGNIGVLTDSSSGSIDLFGGGDLNPPMAGVNFLRDGDRRA